MWGLIPGSGRSPEGGYGNPLQYSCLGKPTDRGAWWAAVHRVTKSRTRLKWLSTYTCTSHSKFHSNCCRVCSFSLTGQTVRENHENCLSPSQTHAILLPKFHDVVCNSSVVSDFLQFYGLYAARQAPPSMGFSRQENWSGLPCPFPGDLLDPENEPGLPHCRQTLNRQATREALTLTMLWALISDSSTLQRLFPALLQILATPATLGSWFLIQAKWLSKWDSPISWTGRIGIT